LSGADDAELFLYVLNFKLLRKFHKAMIQLSPPASEAAVKKSSFTCAVPSQI
jgi:hypothetical protein